MIKNNLKKFELNPKGRQVSALFYFPYFYEGGKQCIQHY